jgi:hypothetical protein
MPPPIYIWETTDAPTPAANRLMVEAESLTQVDGQAAAILMVTAISLAENISVRNAIALRLMHHIKDNLRMDHVDIVVRAPNAQSVNGEL